MTMLCKNQLLFYANLLVIMNPCNSVILCVILRYVFKTAFYLLHLLSNSQSTFLSIALIIFYFVWRERERRKHKSYRKIKIHNTKFLHLASGGFKLWLSNLKCVTQIGARAQPPPQFKEPQTTA